MSSKFKLRRCQWYNEFGWPRINPTVKAPSGQNVFLGCQHGNICRYLHPDEPGWHHCRFTPDPRADYYPGGIRPRTPDPPRPSGVRTPERNDGVKKEHISPSLFTNGEEGGRWPGQGQDRSQSRSRAHSPSSRSESRNLDRGGRTISPRPYYSGRTRSRSHSRERYSDRDRIRDRSRDGHRDKGFRRDRDREVRDYDRDRERERNGWRQPATSRFGADSPSHPRGSLDARRQHLLNIGERRRTGTSDRNNSRPPPYTDREDLGATYRTPSASPSINASSKDKAPPNTLGESLNAHHSMALEFPPPPSGPSSGQPPPPPSTSNPRPTSNLNLPPPPDSATTNSSFQTAQPPPDSAITQSSFASQMPSPPNTLAVPQVPTLPGFAVPETNVGKKETVSFEERMKVWDQRIELLLEATSARQKYKALASDLKALKQLTSSSQFSGFAPAYKTSMLTSVKEAEMRCEEARNHADMVLKKIYTADFWPVRKRPGTAQADGAEDAPVPGTDWEEEHELMKNEVSDLSTAVHKIDRTLQEVVAFVYPLTRSTSISSTVVPPLASRESVDIEMKDSTRAAKRRRVEEDEAPSREDVVAGPSTPIDEKRVETSALFHDSLDVARLIRHVERIEGQLADLENIATQAEASVLTTVEDQMDTRLEEFHKDFKRRQSEAIAALKAEIEQAGSDITEISSEMAELIQRGTDASNQLQVMKEEEDRLSHEVAEMKENLAKERARSDEMQGQLEKYLEETRALSLLVRTAHSTPPPPPFSWSVDDIVEAIRPIVIDAVRVDLTDSMQEMRTHISQFVKANSTSSVQLDLLREKVEKVKRLPEVSQLIERMVHESNPKPNGYAKNLLPPP